MCFSMGRRVRARRRLPTAFSQPWSGYDYDTLADDLAAVIEQTGAKDAVLAGSSLGG